MEIPLLEKKTELDAHEPVEALKVPRDLFSLDYVSFGWIYPLLRQGYQRQLEENDLPNAPSEMLPETCGHHLWNLWMDECDMAESRPSFYRVLAKAYVLSYVKIGIIKLINDSLSFATPFFLHELISYLDNEEDDGKFKSSRAYGLICAFCIGFITLIKAVFSAHYSYEISKINLKVKAAIMSVVFRKSLSIDSNEKSKFSEGEIVNLFSIDCEKITNLCASLHELWSLPLQIILALFLLYQQLKYSFLAGLLFVVILIPINRFLAHKISSVTEHMMQKKDERIRLISEMLTSIKIIKLFCWEDYFFSKINLIRSQEMKNLAIRKYLDAFCVYFWATTPIIFSFFSFFTYVYFGNDLNAAKVFTSMALFNILLSPLNSFPWVVNGIVEANISVKRFTRFISSKNFKSNKSVPANRLSGERQHTSQEFENYSVMISGASFSWEPKPDIDYLNSNNNSEKKVVEESTFKGTVNRMVNDDHESEIMLINEFSNPEYGHEAQNEKNFCLRNLNLRIPKGAFVVICGKVGSGKTSLLESILGEMNLLRGKIYVNGSVSYVSQTPWIKSGNIRENIIFDENYDEQRYFQVLHDCGLLKDVSSIRNFDLCEIGEKGLNLSGGQKTRIALARAMYKQSEIILMDDVFSSLDIRVSDHILKFSILGNILKDSTRILCTHNLNAIKLADYIIMMDQGTIEFFGSSNQYQAIYTENYFTNNELSVDDQTSVNSRMGFDDSEMDETRQNFENWDSSKISQLKDDIHKFELNEKKKREFDIQDDLIESEFREVGSVKFRIYKYYFKCVTYSLSIIILASLLFMQISKCGNDLFLSYFVEKTKKNFSDQLKATFLKMLSMFAVLNTVFTLFRSFSFAFGGIKAAKSIHENILKNVLSADILFFDQNPTGRIINRFSSDQFSIDDSLPFIANIFLANFFNFSGILFILMYSQFSFFVVLFPLTIIYFELQKFFRSTAREIRRIENTSKSPIYSFFNEILDGIKIIRAFECQNKFIEMNDTFILKNQRANFCDLVISNWLFIRLQVISCSIILFISLFSIITSKKFQLLSMPFNNASLTGLCLSYALPIINLLNDLLTSFSQTEKEMISVERINQYSQVEEEFSEGHHVSIHWPSDGRLEFRHVSLRYRPDLPLAIKNLSFVINGGEKLAIAGRTGAGKSTIISAIFRLYPISSGQILIDGLDISTCQLHQIRKRFCIIPQMPFLFQGSIKENLDPENVHSDEVINRALSKCHLSDIVSKLGGIHKSLNELGAFFSLGEKQLLCLARALLKKSKIVIMDEFTANIDPTTSSLLNDAIQHEFTNLTVLVIAHRLTTLLSFPRILLIEDGTLVDDGNPNILITNPESKFAQFAKHSVKFTFIFILLSLIYFIPLCNHCADYYLHICYLLKQNLNGMVF